LRCTDSLALVCWNQLMKSAFVMSLVLATFDFEDRCRFPLNIKGVKLDCGYRIDLLVDEAVIVELKCVEKLQAVHDAQLLTYMMLTGKTVGLIFNFYTAVPTRGGVVRKALSRPSALRASASPRL